MNAVENMGKDTVPYKDTVKLLENDPRVKAELGSPIEVLGIIDSAKDGVPGNITVTDQTFNAVLRVTGPNGSGTLYIDAASDSAGNWTYSRQELQIDGSGTIIDFAPASGPGTGGAGNAPGTPNTNVSPAR